jgi:CDP-diacylglycerol--glycerol-3-phosphate 3-phosphatidyltransferase
VRSCFERGITANQVTLSAGVVSVLIGLLLAALPGHMGLFALIPLWMIVRMALNAIDGMLAREFGQKSNLGAYLNELCDVIADAALYLPFALIPGVATTWVVLVVLLSIVSEYAGVLGTAVGASRRYDGPMGKSDRAFCFGVLGAGVAIGLLPASLINAVLLLVALLLIYTLYNRVRRGLVEAATPPQQE